MNLITHSKNDIAFINNCGFSFKDEYETETFTSFVNYLIKTSKANENFVRNNTNNFFYGYNIPQIGKEFDLLRIGSNYNINIELKSTATLESQIKQLERNQYYLKFLENKTFYISYNAEDNRLILLEENGSADQITIDRLLKVIEEQETNVKQVDYDYYFDPKNYMVSPFNNTEKFIKGEYLLTSHQENIKRDIQKDKHKAFMIEGSAGTGKSLILYDVAKYLTANTSFEEVIIVHCGGLNEGHRRLISKGLNIIPAKDVINYLNTDKIKYILIDEAQRFYVYQFEFVIKLAAEKNICLIFSLDKNQDFFKKDNGIKRREQILEFTKKQKGKNYKLSKKIRSNNEIIKTIEKIYRNSNEDNHSIKNENNNVSITYIDDINSLHTFSNYLSLKSYMILGYTPSRYALDIFDIFNEFPWRLPQNVIGQEFDNVAVIINDSFFYHQTRNGSYELKVKDGSYYSGEKMLYQNMSRAVSNLKIIVVNNPSLYKRITSLFSNV